MVLQEPKAGRSIAASTSARIWASGLPGAPHAQFSVSRRPSKCADRARSLRSSPRGGYRGRSALRRVATSPDPLDQFFGDRPEVRAGELAASYPFSPRTTDAAKYGPT